MKAAGIEPATFRFVAQHLNLSYWTNFLKKPGILVVWENLSREFKFH